MFGTFIFSLYFCKNINNVCVRDTDISGIDISTDPAEGGEGQLVKGESLWDEEW